MKKPTFLVSGYPATLDQHSAISLCMGGGDVRIRAGAGTGKTSLLDAIGRHKKGKGLYISFSADIVEEARARFSRKVKCYTGHGLAYQKEGRFYRRRLKRRLTGGIVAKTLSLVSVHEVSAFMMGTLAIETVSRFCQSADDELSSSHVPFAQLRKIKEKGKQEDVREAAFNAAKALWKNMMTKTGKLPVTHDFYLKKWALTNPVLDVDFILMDESQDMNDVMIDLLKKQTCQIIWVGDDNQSIYTWRGAVNAMQKLDNVDDASISQSFRFGQVIADLANRILAQYCQSNLVLTGFDEIESNLKEIDHPDAIICRTNAEAMRYMVAAVDNDVKAAFAGGSAELLKQVSALKALNTKGKTNHPDFAMFSSYESVVGYSFTPDGSEFKPMIAMINEYGFDKLIALLKKIKDTDEVGAELIITTAHKAKGLEWNSVKLGSDFKFPGSPGFNTEEANLLYVAVTRAKYELDIEGCPAVLKLIGDEEKAKEILDDKKAAKKVVKIDKKAALLEAEKADFITLANKLSKEGVDIYGLLESKKVA